MIARHHSADLNETTRNYPLDVCLHQLVDLQVAETPDRIAVGFEDQTLTFHELSAKANQVAQFLRAQACGNESLVGVCMERSLELSVALLGVLKAGAAYVPLDPDYPADRLDQMIDDAQMPLILSQQHLVDQLPSLRTDCDSSSGPYAAVCLDAQWDEHFGGQSKDAPTTSVGADNLAYVIYTSGTTGRPKGVMNTHRGICNRLLWMQEQYQLDREDRVLQKTPASFDVSVWEFFWTLISGAQLVYARPGGHRDNTYLCELIQGQQITVMHFVPSMLRVFLQEPRVERCHSLRDVICSGEALAVDLQELFFDRLDARLHNLYGPTEAAIDVTFWECRRDGSLDTVPIGRPVANTQIHLLNEQREHVDAGQAGELHIGGVQVARGYLNRPELTSEKFISDPFSTDPEARLYRTGDLARYLPDGNIDFLGRMDHQVKIRGFRIELIEIESVLMQHPNVKLAAVAARDYGSGDQRLVAYLVPENTQEEGPTEFVQQARRWIQDKLPEYMTPAVFMTLPELPLTPSGKLDRNELPAPPTSRPDLEQPFAPPRTEIERRLTQLWQDLLHLDQIGIHDRFFELGGDSLRAARFVNALQEALGEFIYVVTIFQAPTIGMYAELLQRDYAEAVSRWLGVGAVAPDPSQSSGHAQERRVDQVMVQRMRDLVPRTGLPFHTNEKRNPPAIFILAPPRSGTTLLRVMLAGHSRLFAATELQLLCFDTLRERRAAFEGRFSAWLEGTVRAVMELKQCSADDAKQIIRKYEEQDYTTQQFYRLLQQWTGDRMLVDKSPHYALDAEALRKAERDFESPFYIHLVRHPYSMVRSFENQHMDQILYLNDHDFSARRLGELVWMVSHQNTLAFLEQIPPARQLRIHFEELTRSPRSVMETLCATLDVEFDPGVLQPYQQQDKKMVDGIYAASTPMGDVNFLRHRKIDAHVADRWKEVEGNDFLGEVTWDVAQRLGYERPNQTDATDDGSWSERKSVAHNRRQQLKQQRKRRTRTRGIQ